MKRRNAILAVAAMGLGLAASGTWAQSKYSPGASDREIKIGQTMPYSGPLSVFGTLGKVQVAYAQKLNAEGGINGRKLTLLSLDDGYSPPKTLEMTRKLVEQDEVLAIFATLGTPTNTAIHPYLNSKKVPHIFITSGASKWSDPKGHPWTLGFTPNFYNEASVYADHVLATRPNAKVAILYQNDDFGKDYLNGFKERLGDKAKAMVVAEVSYSTTDATVDSQLLALKGSGADVFLNVASAKFAAQAIRKAAEIGWKPVHYLNNNSSNIGGVLTPAGVDNATGLITVAYLKDPTDKRWANDEGVKGFLEFMAKYYPAGDVRDYLNAQGYTQMQTLQQVLTQAGNDLTRENLMRQAASLKDFRPPMLLPGLAINTSPTDYTTFKSLQLVRFDGSSWAPMAGK